MEDSETSHQSGAEELSDETFIPVVGPDIPQYRHHITGTRNGRKPFTILILGIGDDARDVLHHRKTQRIWIKARKARIVEVRLKHNVGVRLQEFEKIAIGNATL